MFVRTSNLRIQNYSFVHLMKGPRLRTQKFAEPFN